MFDDLVVRLVGCSQGKERYDDENLKYQRNVYSQSRPDVNNCGVDDSVFDRSSYFDRSEYN